MCREREREVFEGQRWNREFYKGRERSLRDTFGRESYKRLGGKKGEIK